MKISRSTLVKAVAAAGVALAAMGTASVAEARVFASVGINLAPGINVGVTNGGYYPQPVYVQPAPVYYQPAPVYYQPQTYYAPAPVYYAPPVFGVTYIGGGGWGGGHRYHGGHHGHYGHR
jgi:hypothetical protein